MIKVNILLVDNDYNFGYVLKKELEEHYFKVDHVNDGLDAIINFIEKKYEFVLLEVYIPKVGGIETLIILDALRQKKKINADAKIITFSCENGKKGKETSCFGSIKYYKKPFNIESLVAFMERQMAVETIENNSQMDTV